jgi:hypothetical protein
MSLTEIIRDTALVGYVIGASLVIVGIVALVGSIIASKDDGYRPIGESAPSPSYVSPFANNRDGTRVPPKIDGEER